jgi:hypothetical protein
MNDFLLTLMRRIYFSASAMLVALIFVVVIPSEAVAEVEWVVTLVLTILTLFASASAAIVLRKSIFPVAVLLWIAVLYFALTSPKSSDWVLILAVPLVVGPIMLVATIAHVTAASEGPLVERIEDTWGARVTAAIYEAWARRYSLVTDFAGFSIVFLGVSLVLIHFLR